jgi:hypothetical protein
VTEEHDSECGLCKKAFSDIRWGFPEWFHTKCVEVNVVNFVHCNRKITVWCGIVSIANTVFTMIVWLCFKTNTKYNITPNDRNAIYAKCRNWNVTERDQRVFENETGSNKLTGSSTLSERQSQPNKKATCQSARKGE